MTVVKACNATVHIGLSTAIEGYLMPNGTFRYGLTYVSSLLGYANNWLSRLLKTDSNKLKALQCNGFQGYIIEASVQRIDRRGSPTTKTLSFDDFCVLVEFEAVEEKNPKAIALLTASFREILRSRTQEAFGLPQDPLEKRIAFFQLSFEERETILAEDREDLKQLELYGDVELESWWQYRAEIYLHLNYEG